ncbi:MAG TPA: hypothetical protein PKN50_20850, partial [Spirochaetota bacterium]|nr:hypothetical protein [Spirochaetota bacterium]
MARFRAVMILFVLMSLFMDQALLSKSMKKSRPRYPRQRYVKVRKEKPKPPPDPALEWRDCGDMCLRQLFN